MSLPEQKRMARNTLHALQVFGYNLMVALLVLQLAVPQMAYAWPDAPGTASESTAESTSAQAPVAPKDDSIDDGAFLGVQRIVYPGGSLTLLELGRNRGRQYPDAESSPLEVTPSHTLDLFTLKLSLPGVDGAHEIVMPGGTPALDARSNNQYAFFVLSDGTQHVIDIAGARASLYNAPIDVFYLGRLPHAKGARILLSTPSQGESFDTYLAAHQQPKALPHVRALAEEKGLSDILGVVQAETPEGWRVVGLLLQSQVTAAIKEQAPKLQIAREKARALPATEDGAPTASEANAATTLNPDAALPRTIQQQLDAAAQAGVSEEAKKALFDQIAAVGKAAVPIALGVAKETINLLLDQEMVELAPSTFRRYSGLNRLFGWTPKRWDLSEEDLDRPLVAMTLQQVRLGLAITIEETGAALLTVDGVRYGHRFRLPEGAKFVDFDWNDEVIDLIDDNEVRYKIEIGSLPYLMCQAAVPLFKLGKAHRFGAQKINRVRILRRMYDPVDRSRASLEARLDLNENTRKKAVLIADGTLVQQMEDNLQLVKPIAMEPELKTFLQKHSPKNEGKVWHDAGDLALIYVDDQGNEVMVGRESQYVDAAAIGLQMGPISGMWNLASPEYAQSLRDMAELQESGKAAVEELLNDTEALHDFHTEGIAPTLGRIPGTAMNALHSYPARVFERSREAAANGALDAIRDRYTPEEAEEDYKGLESLVDDAGKTAVTAAGRAKWDLRRYKAFRRSWNFGLLSKVKTGFGIAKGMQRATTVLKWLASKESVRNGAKFLGTAIATDYMVAHGQYVADSISILGSILHFTVSNTVPVVENFSYMRDMIAYSLTTRLGVFLSIFGVAAIARPFCQHGINTLITAFGLKYLFGYTTIPPQQAFAMLTGTTRGLRVAAQGGFSTALSLPFITPLMSLIPAVNRALTQAGNDKMNDKARKRGLVTALTIHAWSVKNKKDPIEAVNALKSTKSYEEIQTLATVVADMVEFGDDVDKSKNKDRAADDAELATALEEEPDAFYETYAVLKQKAAEIASTGQGDSLTATQWARSVAVRNTLIFIGTAGQAQFRLLMNPRPPEDFSAYIVGAFTVDSPFSIAISALVGPYADPAVASKLAYQQAIWFYHTHQDLIINDLEQFGLHLGASNASDFMSAGSEVPPLFAHFMPAGRLNKDRDSATRSLSTDLGSMIALAFTPWRNNWITGIGVRSWNQCFVLLQGMTLLGVGIRLFEEIFKGAPLSSLAEGGTWEKALAGQLFFVMLAPFPGSGYRYLWAMVITTMRTLGQKIAGLSSGYQDRMAQLERAVELKDWKTAEAQALWVLTQFNKRLRAIPDAVIESVQRKSGEGNETWSARVLLEALANSPVPEGVNQRAVKTVIFVFCIITTILSNRLMSLSMGPEHFMGPDGNFGFDLVDWNLMDGPSAKDGIPAIMVKSLLTILAFWGAGHAINMIGPLRRMMQSLPDSPEYKAAEGEFVAAAKGASEMPIVSALKPRAPTYDTVEKIHNDCAQHMAAHAAKVGEAFDVAHP